MFSTFYSWSSFISWFHCVLFFRSGLMKLTGELAPPAVEPTDEPTLFNRSGWTCANIRIFFCRFSKNLLKIWTET